MGFEVDKQIPTWIEVKCFERTTNLGWNLDRNIYEPWVSIRKLQELSGLQLPHL